MGGTTQYDARVSQNVRTLIQQTGLRTQKALAHRLEWRQDKLSDLLNGVKSWSVAEVARVGNAFGFYEDPFILTRPYAEISAALDPSLAATGTDGGYTVGRSVEQKREFTYRSAPSSATVIAFPQVRRPAREMARLASVRVLHSHQLNEPNSPMETSAIRVKHA